MAEAMNPTHSPSVEDDTSLFDGVAPADQVFFSIPDVPGEQRAADAHA